MKHTRPEDIFRAEKERAVSARNSQHARLLAEAKAAFDKLMAEGQAARKSGRPRKHPLPPLKTSSSRIPPRPPAPPVAAAPKPATLPPPVAKPAPSKPTPMAAAPVIVRGASHAKAKAGKGGVSHGTKRHTSAKRPASKAKHKAKRADRR